MTDTLRSRARPPKYRTQKDTHTCGPVAVYNAMLWQTGIPPDWDTVLRTCDPCKVDGTSIDRICVGSVSLRTTKVDRMRGWLDAGHGFVLLYASKPTNGHYVFVHPHRNHTPAKPRFVVRNSSAKPWYIHRYYTRWHPFAQKCLKPYRAVDPVEVFPVAWKVPKLT